MSLYNLWKGKNGVSKLESRIPELIKSYLDEKKLTQKEFAKITGIDAAALSRLINSRQKQIDIRTLEKLHGHIPLDYGNLVAVIEEFEPVADDGKKRRNTK